MPVPPGVDQGRGDGMWCAPTPLADGMVAGVLYASDGSERYVLAGDVIAPGAQRMGALHGVLSPVLAGGPDPYPMSRILVLGSWAAPEGEHGQFQGMILMSVRSVPLPAVLGMMEGSFDLTPPAALDLSDRRRHRLACACTVAPWRRGPFPQACTKGPDLLQRPRFHGGAQPAEPQPGGNVIVCPKGPEVWPLAAADLAEPSVYAPPAPVARNPAALAGASKLGPQAPAGPLPADAIRRGPMVLRWFLDS
jgi:hypothetical protein